MAEEVAKKLPKIDILINNAGVFTSKVDTVANGVDVRLAVNYFSPLRVYDCYYAINEKS